MTKLHLYLDRFDTPLGPFAIVADAEGRYHAAGWTGEHPRMERMLEGWAAAPDIAFEEKVDPGGATRRLTDYFAGDLAALDGATVALEGTEFQRTVWQTLAEIPCGRTWSYKDLAARIGRPSAVRAVGLANGANPVAVILPCHRVVGADGSLTGYGGGLDRKRWLLDHERGARPQRELWPEDRASVY